MKYVYIKPNDSGSTSRSAVRRIGDDLVTLPLPRIGDFVMLADASSYTVSAVMHITDEGDHDIIAIIYLEADSAA